MNSEQSAHAKFWLALLEFGDNEEQRQRNWNVYCNLKFGPRLGQFDPGNRLEAIWQRLMVEEISRDDGERLARFANGFCDDASLAEDLSFPRPLMNFKGVEFREDVSFAGRLLLGAEFNDAVFKRKVDFGNAEFQGITQFTDAKFKSREGNLLGEAVFDGSTFYGLVKFDGVRFPSTTSFEQVKFNGPARFNAAEFMQGDKKSLPPYALVHFEQSQFRKDADFSDVVFDVGASFRHVKFESTAKFEGVAFRFPTCFNNVEFKGATSFRKASFDMPPSFFAADLQEDIDFSRVDWSGAERSYNRRCRCDDAPDEIERDAGNAVRAWDRMALIMSQHEKPPERHEFFRLKMRAQRQRDGNSLSSASSWLFDFSSDFGWGINRALYCWIGHILLGAAILAAPVVAGSGNEIGFWSTVWVSMLVSFSNSLAFLRLGSEGGYLHGPHEALLSAAGHAEWVFATVGTIQAVLGPIFLFLVLLTLRNRFRLG